MKKFFKVFFIILGVIFLLLLIAAAYVYISLGGNPLSSTILHAPEGPDTLPAVVKEDANPALSESQEQTLRKVGIDPAALPSELTPAQEQCFIDKFGMERVMEIVDGDTPTALELIKGKGCLE